VTETRIPMPNDFTVAQHCFACGPRNDRGLGLAFAVEGTSVVADFAMPREFSGAPRFVHGGVVMTVLDEAMAWSTIGIRRRFALTKSFEVDFAVPVLVGQPYTARGIPGPLVEGSRVLEVRGEIRAADGTLCASARGDYWLMTAEELAAATGLPALTEEFLRYEFPEPPA
jgi:acyl-coenzyme A thioesterase PaaI-like protein